MADLLDYRSGEDMIAPNKKKTVLARLKKLEKQICCLLEGIYSIVNVSASYSAQEDDYTINATGTITVTIPVSQAGKIYVVKNSGVGTVSVSTLETIDGAPSPLNIAAGDSATIQYDEENANWITI